MRKVGFGSSSHDLRAEARQTAVEMIEMLQEELGQANDAEMRVLAEVTKAAAASYARQCRQLRQETQ